MNSTDVLSSAFSPEFDEYASLSNSSLNPHRVIYSTFSPDYIKKITKTHYCIQEPESCVLYHRGTSDIYRIFAGAQSYALRLYRSNWRSRQDILTELKAIKCIGDAGAVVARPIPRPDGSEVTDVLAPEGIRSAVLFEWIHGSTPKYTNSDDMTRFGAALATFHLAGDALAGDIPCPKLDMDYLFTHPLLQLTKRVKNISSMAERITSLGCRIREHIQNVSPFLWDWGFCHGDVWVNNAHIDSARVVLFDFEFCGYGWRLADLAGHRYDTVERGVEDVAWRPFIEGYLATRPAAVKSLKEFGVFMILTCLWTTAYRIQQSETAGSELAGDDFVEHMVSECERIEVEVRQGRYSEEFALFGR